MAYEAQGVHFDGTNDYLSKASDLTGNADSKNFTVSFWFRFTTPATTFYVYDNGPSLGAQRFKIVLNANGEVDIEGRNSAGTKILDYVQTTDDLGDGEWHHFMGARNGTDHYALVDGLADNDQWLTDDDDTIDFTQPLARVGSRFDNNFKLNGDLADLQLKFGTYTDLSVQANQDALYYRGGAVSLSGGIVLLAGATATWHTNDGTGGGFTENGALTDASANPPKVPLIGSGHLHGTKLERPRLIA